MTYISWATFHEGGSDAAYLEVLLPRVMEDLVARRGVHNSDIPINPSLQLGQRGREIEEVAAEACEAKDAFEIVFIHADTGGRALEEGIADRSSSYCGRMFELCGWLPARCVQIIPRHETEAWVLADPAAVLGALGYRGSHEEIGLPPNARAAEQLPDPKAVLANALRAVAGPRRRRARVEQLFPAIAQRQNLSELRRSLSFRQFEASLVVCLQSLGCIQ